MTEARPQRTWRDSLARWIERWRSDPNPLLVRELQQAARLTRTPVILSGVTCVVTLAVASVGGIASMNQEPASVGVAVFQSFFSMAFALVAWVGPAVAASTIAGERSAQTWELLILTGMSPARVARGKFLAALTYVYLYVVMLAPVAMLAFLFGGISVLELVSAFALLCVAGALWVALGLSISSKLASPGAAIIVTLVTAIPLSFACYLALGLGGSYLAHTRWPAIPGGLPVWLPTAYARVPLDTAAILLLIACPLLLMAIPAWFFYEVTVANLSSISDDRSSGLRLWFVVSAPLLAGMLMLPGTEEQTMQLPILVTGILTFECFLVAMAFVFAGEPLGPARRLAHRWRIQGVSTWRRFLGPSVINAAATLLAVGAICIGVQLAIAILVMKRIPSPPPEALGTLVTAASHSLTFTVFAVGLTAWLRSRSRSSLAPRFVLSAVLFVIVVGPWVLMAIAGWAGDSRYRDHLIVAAPSPAYVPVMFQALSRGTLDPEARLRLIVGTASMATWLLAGLCFLPLAARRTRRVLEEHSSRLDALEAALESEERNPDATAGEPIPPNGAWPSGLQRLDAAPAISTTAPSKPQVAGSDREGNP